MDDHAELARAPERVLNGIVSRHEAPVLQWLATRIPSRVVPDHLTYLGLLGAFVTAFGCVFSYASRGFLALAVAGLVLNWLGDSLDGTLARLRDIQRPRYGFYLDHMVDVASQALIVLGLGLSPLMRFDVACLGLIVYLAFSVHVFAKLHVMRTMELTFYGVGPTEVRLLIGVSLTAAIFGPRPVFQSFAGPLTPFDIGTLALVVIGVGMLFLSVFKNLQTLGKLDPPKSNDTFAAVRNTAIDRDVPDYMRT